jgi:hypothetical protein
MPLYLVQLLCPKRHTILVRVYETEGGEVRDLAEAYALKTQWEVLLESGAANPWCGICGSPELRFESGKTRWETLKEAAPFIKEDALKNAIARAVIDKGRSRDQ